jgi:hypothetical protein
MIQVQLSPEVEARIQAQARTQGIEAASYLQSLIENAVRHSDHIPAPWRPTRHGSLFRGNGSELRQAPPASGRGIYT